MSGCTLTLSGGGTSASLGLTVSSIGSITADTNSYFYGNTSVTMTCLMSGSTYTASFFVSINNYCSIASGWNVNSGAFSAQEDIIKYQYSSSNLYTHTYPLSTFFSVYDPWSSYCYFANCKIVNYITASSVCGTTVITTPISFTYVDSLNYQLQLDTTNLGSGEICYQCQVLSSTSQPSNYNYRTINNGWVYWKVTDDPCYGVVNTNVQSDCNYIRQADNTYTAGTSDPICAFVASDSLTGYQIYDSTNTNPLCNIQSYALYTTQNQVMTVVTSTQVQMNTATGQLNVFIYPTLSSAYYRIKITLADGYTKYTNWFIVSVTCGVTSQIIANPSNYSASADQTQTFCIKSGQIPVFTFGTFLNQGNSDCTISAYYQFSDSTGTLKATNMVSSPYVSTYGTSGYVNIEVSNGFYYVPAVYTFALQIYATGGYTYWAQVSSNTLNTLNVVCCQNSTTITISTTNFKNSLSNIQYVDVSLATTYFILPLITTSMTNCQLVSYQSSSSGSSYIADINLNNPSVYDGTYLTVSPTNTALNYAYTFYVYVQATGGADQFSELYTLVVGCVQSHVFFTFPSLVTSHILHVADSPINVYQFSQVTTVPTYCTVQIYSIVTESSTIGSTSQFYMKKSSLCLSGDNTCNKVDISKTSNTTTLLWYIQVTARNGVTQNSAIITTQILCQASSSSVYASSPTVSTQMKQYNITNNVFYFPVFTCQYSDCCTQITYYILNSNTYQPYNVYDQSLFSNAVEYNLDKYKTTVYTGAIQVYYFYIQGCNPFNVCNITYQLKINVTYNCMFDEITLNPNMPLQQKEPMALSYQQRNGLPILVFKKELGSIKNYSVDLTRRFQNNASYYCNIIAYRISKVSVLNTNFLVPQNTWQQIFTIDNTSGLFQIIKFTQPFNDYTVYLQAYNGQIWGGDNVQYLVDVTITTGNFIPLYPPTFVQDINTISNSLHLNLNVTKYLNGSFQVTDNRIVQFKLPQTDDAYKLPVAIILNNQRDLPYLNVNQSTGIITVNTSMLIINQIGSHVLNIILVDAIGASRVYNITMTFISSITIIQSQKQIKIQKDQFIGRQVVSAEIESINEYGLMKISFNDTMYTDFNHSLINQTRVQIYILPALKRDKYEGFDSQQIDLTWKLVSYNNTAMYIQLYFKNPLEISQLVVFDQIIWNVTSIYQLFYSLISNQSQAYGSYGFQGTRILQPVNQKPLYKDYYILKAKVRKQFPLNLQEYNNLFGYLDILVNLLFSNGIISLFFGILFSNTLWMTLAYIRYLQITLHLPMMSIVVPSNAIIFMSKTLPVPRLDIFKWFFNQYQTSKFFDINFQKQMRDTIQDQTWELGYQSHNSLINLSTISIAIPVFFATLIVLFTIVYLIQIFCYDQGLKFYLFKVTYKIWIKLKKFILFGFILFIMIFGFMEIAIASKYAISIFKKDPIGELFSSVCAIIGVLIDFVFLPIVFIWYLRKFKKRRLEMEGGNIELSKYLKKDKYITKNSFIMLSYQIQQKQRLQLFFYPLCLLRRFLYLMTVFWVKNRTYQILSMMALNLGSLIYVGHSSPMKHQIQNIYEYYSQLSICLVTMHMIYFTDYAQNQQIKFNYGTSMIIIICLHLVCSLLYSYIVYFNYVKLIFQFVFNFIYKYFYNSLCKPFKDCLKSPQLKKTVHLKKQSDQDNIQINEITDSNILEQKQIQFLKSNALEIKIKKQIQQKKVRKLQKIKKPIKLDLSEIKESINEISKLENQITQDEQLSCINVLKDNIQNLQKDGNLQKDFENQIIQNKNEDSKNNYGIIINDYYLEVDNPFDQINVLQNLKDNNQEEDIEPSPFYYQFEEEDKNQTQHKEVLKKKYINKQQDQTPFYYSFNEKNE